MKIPWEIFFGAEQRAQLAASMTPAPLLQTVTTAVLSETGRATAKKAPLSE